MRYDAGGGFELIARDVVVPLTVAILLTKLGDPKETYMDDMKNTIKTGIDKAADKAKQAGEKAVDKTKEVSKEVGSKVKEAGQKITEQGK